MSRTVLIDADILIYQVAMTNEVPTRFDNGLWVLWADEDKTKADFDEALASIVEKTKSVDYLLCLTSPTNFRKDILPTYKGNRKETRKPMMLPFLRRYVIENYVYDMREGLEGDDLMGIYATNPSRRGESIIYSLDKDMKTIPAKLWDHKLEIVTEVTPEEADRNWFTQTLTGDVTDGYKGCPKVGPVAAAKILDKECSWEAVVSAFEKAGLTERDALQQAQVARILRHEDYDIATGTIKVWTP
jgi:DNA polymerase-1